MLHRIVRCLLCLIVAVIIGGLLPTLTVIGWAVLNPQGFWQMFICILFVTIFIVPVEFIAAIIAFSFLALCYEDLK